MKEGNQKGRKQKHLITSSLRDKKCKETTEARGQKHDGLQDERPLRRLLRPPVEAGLHRPPRQAHRHRKASGQPYRMPLAHAPRQRAARRHYRLPW